MTLSRRDFLALTAGVLGACSTGRQTTEQASHPTVGAPPTTASYSPPAMAVEPPSTGPSRFVRSGPPDRPGVAFTFHGSGDPKLFDQLLAVAGRTGAPITVFAVGNWIEAHPELGPAILTAGHELANHTYTHPSMAGLAQAAVASEITRCRDALARHAGLSPNWFRPSGVMTPGPVVLTEAWRAGYGTVVGYDVDPLDYQDPGAEAVIARTVAGLHPGAIVSLHTGHAGTVAAFAPMVEAARARGLHPLLVRDLLASAR